MAVRYSLPLWQELIEVAAPAGRVLARSPFLHLGLAQYVLDPAAQAFHRFERPLPRPLQSRMSIMQSLAAVRGRIGAA